MHRQLTVQEAARELGVSTRTVERRIRAGELMSVFVGGRRLVVAHHGWDSDTQTDTNRQAVSELAPGVGSTDNSDRQADNPDTDNSDTVSVLKEQLARSDERAERLMGLLEEQNRTIRDLSQTNRGLVVRVAQLEGRVLSQEATAPAETLREAPQAQPVTDTPSPHRRGLKGLYRAWRGR